MSLRDRITEDLKSAMRAKDALRLSTLRLVQAAIKDRDIAARAEDRCDGCEESEILALLQKLVKQREESAATYENAGRLDLAEREQAEADIVRTYLPTPMDETEIEEAAETVVEELGATGLKDMGKCMGALKRRYTGRMDFSKAGETVKTLLQSRA
ncbi:GatB/YqeY domain-containing protein [Glycocaulis sp.]|uniref:GatB/YqeY domain-containing protein n=1 Tax=Glycocaulis sp. TaxID=1969725 RepID=UPI0025C5E361|nr:GatB/YqeY domain-containing protein [Glycocaulis sp.]MCH8522088.1 GatB/YqeY domain-containing protein [Glycocaulis sp.]